MTNKNSIAAIAMFAFNSAFAQSLPNPEVLGVHIGMHKASAIKTISDKYPRARFSPLKKDIAIDAGELIYDGQYVIDLD